jgi:DNA processing protein
MDSVKSITLHLSLIPGIGPQAIKRLLQWGQYHGSTSEKISRATVEDLLQGGFTVEQARRIVTGLADERLLHAEQELLVRHNVKLLMINDADYPHWLREIHVPPPVLYVQGFLAPRALAVALVGSRLANAYGRAVIDRMVPVIVRAGYTIVSGGARGIDIYAHRATQQQPGTTSVVLGSGLLQPYPREHAKIFAEIAAQGGAVVSALPLRTPALPGNFPARNRIIAGLSKACIVVQAAEKSGALITASYALQEGRDVGAVPGSILDPLSAGCHRLLAEGAALLATDDDLLKFLGLELPSVSKQIPVILYEADSTDPVLHACRNPCTFDELLTAARLDASQLHERLWELQIEGKIMQTSSGAWSVAAQ